MDIQKNSKAFKDIQSLANKYQIDIKVLLEGDEHLKEVCEIFYKHMPAAIKLVVKKEKFQDVYLKQRPHILAQLK